MSECLGVPDARAPRDVILPRVHRAVLEGYVPLGALECAMLGAVSGDFSQWGSIVFAPADALLCSCRQLLQV